MLDPDIPQLPPVLRSNFWLTIHVLTIVSSYAAFALAMGLGVAATSLYLTATYKRTAGLFEMASPLLPGVPLLGLGSFGAIGLGRPARLAGAPRAVRPLRDGGRGSASASC